MSIKTLYLHRISNNTCVYKKYHILSIHIWLQLNIIWYDIWHYMPNYYNINNKIKNVSYIYTHTHTYYNGYMKKLIYEWYKL